MLDQVEGIFDNMVPMLKKIKKKTYEPRMEEFRKNYGAYFTEMTEYIDASPDKAQGAQELADAFVEAVKTHAQVKGKINGRKQADMNFFMIYYVFPAILLTEHENAREIADAICRKWGDTFQNSHIGYTTYEKLNESFRNKIFGIF
jgi:hypothetical protein